ncbi:MAG TPA: ATP-binding protein [Acidimicrobiales bacterium]|nr:ATP-binding protein [Acidimicrobiales bacterium]
MSERRFDGETASVGEARAFAEGAVRGLTGEELSSLAVMVSELASNSVRHARSPFRLSVTQQGTDVRVEVTDRGQGTPRAGALSPSALSGRGLRIVEALAETWGVEDDDRGTTVWFVLATGPGSAPPEQRHRARTPGRSGSPSRPGPVPGRSAPWPGRGSKGTCRQDPTAHCTRRRAALRRAATPSPTG